MVNSAGQQEKLAGQAPPHVSMTMPFVVGVASPLAEVQFERSRMGSTDKCGSVTPTGAMPYCAVLLSFRPEARQRRAGAEKSTCTLEAHSVRGRMSRLPRRYAQYSTMGLERVSLGAACHETSMRQREIAPRGRFSVCPEMGLGRQDCHKLTMRV
jgi:hypothetical protein